MLTPMGFLAFVMALTTIMFILWSARSSFDLRKSLRSSWDEGDRETYDTVKAAILTQPVLDRMEREDEELRRKAERESRDRTKRHPRVVLVFQSILGSYPEDQKAIPTRLHNFVTAVHEHFYKPLGGDRPLDVHDTLPTPSVHVVPAQPGQPQSICATAKVFAFNTTLDEARAVAEKFSSGVFSTGVQNPTFTVSPDDPPLSPRPPAPRSKELPDGWWKDSFMEAATAVRTKQFSASQKPRGIPAQTPVEQDDPVVAAVRARERKWAAAKERLNEVSMDLMDFEMDPRSVYFTRPLLRVLTEPATMRFYDSYADAQAWNTESAPSTDDLVDRFAVAVELAAKAWSVADKNARDKAEQDIFTEGERLSEGALGDIETARKLMDRALDGASTVSEAALSWKKSLDLLDRVGLSAPESLVQSLTVNSALVARFVPELEARRN